MARPKPKILREFIDKNTYRSEQILQANTIWTVLYQNKPFNLKSSNAITNDITPKYKKVSFLNSGHAISLAKKLNQLFNCTDFTVVKMVPGEQVFPKNE